MERSWDANVSIPEEVTEDYELAVFSNNLLLIGGRSRSQQLPHKVWIRQEDEWKADIFTPVPCSNICTEILSIANSEHLLFLIYQLREDIPCNTHLLFCYNAIASHWKISCRGPQVKSGDEGIKLAFHDQHLYAMVYTTHKRTSFFKACVSLKEDVILEGDWIPMIIVSDCCIPRNSRFTVFGNKLIFAAFDGQKVKLCIPFESSNGQTFVADVDTLDMEFCGPLCGTFGLPDGSLVVIGDIMDTANNTSTSAVVKFTSTGIIIDKI